MVTIFFVFIQKKLIKISYFFFSRRIIIVTSDSPTNNDDAHSLSDPIVSDLDHTNQYSRIICPHCKNTFIFTDDNYLARCPHCRKLSTINPRFSRIRGTIFLILALILLALTFGVIFGTLSYVQHDNQGYIALDVFLALVFLYLAYRSASYFFMGVSVTV